MLSQTQTLSAAALSARIAPALAALLLGLTLFLASGFAGATVLHNSTHDTRHALGLPCH
jgi:cobalt transporter subunit CbtB